LRPALYGLYFGGNEASTRLARVYKEVIKAEDLMNELRLVLARYTRERKPGERFGDFSDRLLFDNPAVAQG
jgi:sulfite reductase (NADPH) hemoprotein beta-component